MEPLTKVGTVSKYFAKPMVAAVQCEVAFRLGETLLFKGETTDFRVTLSSLQILNAPVQEAKPGVEVGVKVTDRVRPGDLVYRIG